MAKSASSVDWLNRVFGDSKYSDLTIECGESTWHVHRVVICAQSPFFDKACSNGFKETSSKLIKLEDDDPTIVREMLRYLYTGDYLEQTKEGEEGSRRSALSTNVHIHTIADKYDIPALGDVAISKFSARAAREWKTEAFAGAIEEMYTSANENKEPMHKAAVAIAAENAKTLLNDDCGQAFRKIAEAVPKFAAELSIEIVNMKEKMPPTFARYRCPNSMRCNKVNMLEGLGQASGSRTCTYCSNQYYVNVWVSKKLDD
ncbi:hypothetical protein M409DRAFT_26682 [Zasmidium cellare ATCC 36951]|uniref:BTB domain-containing protein n=1 Tax=Zasmidium cellare ATCC 36951 TaxID=1080233 RepID=A0A6A6CBH9_ZASCE|nr:uncharacterized protein M409DRAFT_26682 [Zasmidium cellare ATCC 36951]KAF2162826.1 hypothetical protein M409DRAFT_26682 [Zasmidium cellare ATCC 36951]